MTTQEAEALVLREGMMTEPVLEDAVPPTLHGGIFPTFEQISGLIEAIDIVHESIENDLVINRKIAVRCCL